MTGISTRVARRWLPFHDDLDEADGNFRDLDPHGPAGPTAFWKATDLEISREAVHDVLPNDFFLAFNAVLDTDGTESDLEGEMDYIIEEEEYDIEDDGFEFAPEAGEVSGLLMDAQVEVADLVHQDPPQ